MKFRVFSPGWPIAGGAALLIGDIDADVVPWLKGLTPPLNCQALDTEAWQAMVAAYPVHLLGSPPPPDLKEPTGHKGRRP
jgi:hypothetical protein